MNSHTEINKQPTIAFALILWQRHYA